MNYNMGGESSTQSERFFYADLPFDIVRLGRTFSELEIFLSLKIANLPWNATEEIRYAGGSQPSFHV